MGVERTWRDGKPWSRPAQHGWILKARESCSVKLISFNPIHMPVHCRMPCWRPVGRSTDVHAGGWVVGALGCVGRVFALFAHYNHSSRSLEPQSDLLECAPTHTHTPLVPSPHKACPSRLRQPQGFFLQCWIAGSRQTKLMRWWWLSHTDQTATDAHLRQTLRAISRVRALLTAATNKRFPFAS